MTPTLSVSGWDAFFALLIVAWFLGACIYIDADIRECCRRALAHEVGGDDQ